MPGEYARDPKAMGLDQEQIKSKGEQLTESGMRIGEEFLRTGDLVQIGRGGGDTAGQIFESWEKLRRTFEQRAQAGSPDVSSMQGEVGRLLAKWTAVGGLEIKPTLEDKNFEATEKLLLMCGEHTSIQNGRKNEVKNYEKPLRDALLAIRDAREEEQQAD